MWVSMSSHWAVAEDEAFDHGEKSLQLKVTMIWWRGVSMETCGSGDWASQPGHGI